jgi:rubrerythrin
MYTGELEILKQAILNEHEGYQFYRMAAEKAVDDEVRNVFESMAEEEKRHEEWLRKAYGHMLENKPPIVEPFSVEQADSPGIFSEKRIMHQGLEVSALHVGVMMEKLSIEHYKEALEKTRVEALGNLYSKLARWEQEHLDKLEKAYDFAREEWWEKQNFSPA